MNFCITHPDRRVRAHGLCALCYDRSALRAEKRSIRSKAYYIKNKERIKERSHNQRLTHKESLKDYHKNYNLNSRKLDPLKAILAGAKSRAVKKGLEYTITKEDIQDIPQFCPVLGLELLYGNTGKLKPESASIDRFDNSKGYIPGNVRIISYQANHLKSNGTIEEFKKIIKYMES